MKLMGQPVERIFEVNVSGFWFRVRPGSVIVDKDKKTVRFDTTYDGSEVMVVRKSMVFGVKAQQGPRIHHRA